MNSVFTYIVRGLAVIGFAVMAVSISGWMLFFLREKPKLPETIILTLDMRQEVEEKSEDSLFQMSLGGGALPLRDMIAAIDLAAKDDRVALVIGSFRNDAAGYAEAQEIRDAIYRLRANGKMTYASATSFGELGPADRAYYIASAFDEIWLQPVGVLGLTGAASQMPFFRGALDKIGVQPDFVHREEYKTAADMMSERDFTPANAEMLGNLLDDISMQMVNDISAERRIAPLDLFRLIDRAPLSAADARAAGLIDRIGYFDEAADWALNAFGAGSEMVDAGTYLAMRRAEVQNEKAVDDAPVIAFIHGVGEIAQGGGLSEARAGISADEMAGAIQDAVNDTDVEAILLRLDSPGGSAVASESIRYALSRARLAGLPVVVSMGGMAGSGAYWIALEADHIMADPATLTGSIGVIAGKLAGTGVWETLGVNWGMITRGENADLWTVTAPFTEAQRVHVDRLVGDVYADFKKRVAEGRDLAPEQVDAVAKGRVWTGHQAAHIGLVDGLGGFYDAIAYTKSLLGVDEDDIAMLKAFPAPENVVDRLMKSLDMFGGFGLAMQKLAMLAQGIEPVMAPLLSAFSEKPRMLLMQDTGLAR